MIKNLVFTAAVCLFSTGVLAETVMAAKISETAFFVPTKEPCRSNLKEVAIYKGFIFQEFARQKVCWFHDGTTVTAFGLNGNYFKMSFDFRDFFKVEL